MASRFALRNYIGKKDISLGYNKHFQYNAHERFVGRTVIVQNEKVMEAYDHLNKVAGQEKLLDIWRRTRYFEKPFNTRRRINWEKCKAIYDEDMRRKINFVMKANREDPWIAR